MSEPPKKTRTRKQDVQLVVSCDAPAKGATAEGRSTSVYEIDIQGGYDLHRRNKRGCLEKDLKEASAKEDLEKELNGARQEEVGGHPEARYPKIMETVSGDQRPPRTQNASFIVTRDILTEGNKEKDRKHAGKTNKKRQAMPADTKQKFRKQIKNYIIETFIGDKCREMKNIVQDYHGVLDGNEVHLHHHEHHHHHHHYYPNGKALDGETVTQTPMQENFGESPEIFVATVTTNAKGRETILNCHTEVENSNQTHDPSLSRFIGPTEPQESPSEPSETRSVAPVNGADPKNEHNSAISLMPPIGGTDFIIKKEECGLNSVMMESAEMGVMMDELGKTSQSYISLVENFKTFTSPVVITDQKSVPKILYIRCECSPLKGMGTPEEVDTFQNKDLEGKSDLEKKIENGEDGNRSEADQSENALPNQCPGREEESSEEIAFEVWTSKLKKELQEIKKELKRIEEKQVPEKRSPDTSIRKEKMMEICPDLKLTVFTSKTFIMRPSQDAAADV